MLHRPPVSTARKRQSGFTLLELAIASILVLAIVAGVVAKVSGQSDTVKSQQARVFLTQTMPGALVNLEKSRGPTAAVASRQMLSRYGVGTQTPWGASWSVTNGSRVNASIGIVYPVGGNHAEQTAQALADYLTADDADGAKRFRFINGCDVSGSTVTVRYARLL